VEVAGKVRRPAASRSWHPLARQWYNALGKSGQAQWFEETDWAAAALVAEQITRCLEPEAPATAFRNVWDAMKDLLSLEADRRRARIEVVRPGQGTPPPPGGDAAAVAAMDEVASIAAYRDRISSHR
jgi:hypothetical protein